MSHAQRFLAASLVASDLKAFLKFGDVSHLFEFDPVGAPAYAFTTQYIETTGQLPTIDIVEEECAINFTAEDAAPEWLFQKAIETHIQRALKKVVDDNKETFQKEPIQAMMNLAERMSELQAQLIQPQVSNFKNAIDDLWPYLLNKWNPQGSHVSFGWSYLDNQTGGLEAGDMIGIVGQPGRGKTWFLLWIALHIWRTLKMPVVFVSMEMSKEQILARLAAIYTEVGMDFFKFGQAPNLFLKTKAGTKQQVKAMLTALKDSDLPDFIVVDGNLTATVADVISVCRQYNAAVCLVDGAYALDNEEAKNLYDAVARNVKLLKRSLAAALGIPCICTWQFENLKKLKKGEQPNMDNIGYSRSIQEYSSILLGLFQQDDPSNVENLFQRTVHVLKGRNGEIGVFQARWDFQSMNFGEVTKPDKVELFN
jgi:replicative DNA helicase